MSISSVSSPVYSDPDRLVASLPSERADTARAARQAQGGTESKSLSMFAEGDDSPSFWDLVDVINPLQHIPVVGNLYREATGDKIGVGARLAGGALFGGPIGLAAAMVDCGVEESTGADMGGHMLAMFRDESQSAPETAPATALAAAPKSSTPSAHAAASAPIPLTPTPMASAPAQPLALQPAPAQPQQTAAAVTLPDAPASTGAAMAFSFDTAPASSAPVQAQAPVPVQIAAAEAAPASLLNKPARFMNVPAASAGNGRISSTMVTVPTSTSGTRSNVPVTGRNPSMPAITHPDPASVQRAMAQQGISSDTQHPMLPPTTAKAVEVQTSANPDWFNTMSQAMDKYERATKLNTASAPNTLSIQ